MKRKEKDSPSSTLAVLRTKVKGTEMLRSDPLKKLRHSCQMQSSLFMPQGFCVVGDNYKEADKY